MEFRFDSCAPNDYSSHLRFSKKPSKFRSIIPSGRTFELAEKTKPRVSFGSRTKPKIKSSKYESNSDFKKNTETDVNSIPNNTNFQKKRSKNAKSHTNSISINANNAKIHINSEQKNVSFPTNNMQIITNYHTNGAPKDVLFHENILGKDSSSLTKSIPSSTKSEMSQLCQTKQQDKFKLKKKRKHRKNKSENNHASIKIDRKEGKATIKKKKKKNKPLQVQFSVGVNSHGSCYDKRFKELPIVTEREIIKTIRAEEVKLKEAIFKKDFQRLRKHDKEKSTIKSKEKFNDVQMITKQICFSDNKKKGVYYSPSKDLERNFLEKVKEQFLGPITNHLKESADLLRPLAYRSLLRNWPGIIERRAKQVFLNFQMNGVAHSSQLDNNVVVLIDENIRTLNILKTRQTVRFHAHLEFNSHKITYVRVGRPSKDVGVFENSEKHELLYYDILGIICKVVNKTCIYIEVQYPFKARIYCTNSGTLFSNHHICKVNAKYIGTPVLANICKITENTGSYFQMKFMLHLTPELCPHLFPTLTDNSVFGELSKLKVTQDKLVTRSSGSYKKESFPKILKVSSDKMPFQPEFCPIIGTLRKSNNGCLFQGNYLGRDFTLDISPKILLSMNLKSKEELPVFSPSTACISKVQYYLRGNQLIPTVAFESFKTFDCVLFHNASIKSIKKCDSLVHIFTHNRMLEGVASLACKFACIDGKIKQLSRSAKNLNFIASKNGSNNYIIMFATNSLQLALTSLKVMTSSSSGMMQLSNSIYNHSENMELSKGKLTNLTKDEAFLVKENSLIVFVPVTQFFIYGIPLIGFDLTLFLIEGQEVCYKCSHLNVEVHLEPYLSADSSDLYANLCRWFQQKKISKEISSQLILKASHVLSTLKPTKPSHCDDEIVELDPIDSESDEDSS